MLGWTRLGMDGSVCWCCTRVHWDWEAVIDNSYCRGVPDFETFLNNNLHQLFHLSYRNCCCGNTSNNTHISKYQWDLLYSQISTRNPHGRRGECPCQYKAKNGVTSDVLDITFCLSLPHQLLLWCFTDRCGHHSKSSEWKLSMLIPRPLICKASKTSGRRWNKLYWAYPAQCRQHLKVKHRRSWMNMKNHIIDPRELESLVTIMKDHRDYCLISSRYISTNVLTIVVSVLNRQFSYPFSERSIRIIHTPNLEVQIIRIYRFGITAWLTFLGVKCEVGMTLWWNGNCIWRQFVGRLARCQNVHCACIFMILSVTQLSQNV